MAEFDFKRPRQASDGPLPDGSYLVRIVESQVRANGKTVWLIAEVVRSRDPNTLDYSGEKVHCWFNFPADKCKFGAFLKALNLVVIHDTDELHGRELWIITKIRESGRSNLVPNFDKLDPNQSH